MRIGEKDGLQQLPKLLCKYAERESCELKKKFITKNVIIMEKVSDPVFEWLCSLSRRHHRIYLKCFEKENFRLLMHIYLMKIPAASDKATRCLLSRFHRPLPLTSPSKIKFIKILLYWYWIMRKVPQLGWKLNWKCSEPKQKLGEIIIP